MRQTYSRRTKTRRVDRFASLISTPRPQRPRGRGAFFSERFSRRPLLVGARPSRCFHVQPNVERGGEVMARAVQRLTPAMVARGRHARRECRALTADVARRTAGSIGRPVFHRRPRAADGAGGGRCLNACCPLKSCGLGLSLLQRPERRPRSARTRSRPGAPNGPPSRPNSKWRGGTSA